MTNSKRILGSTDWEKQYYSYRKTLELLKQKYNATREELAAWVYVGPENGGISAYTNVNEFSDPPCFFFSLPTVHVYESDSDSESEVFDYVKELHVCYFKVDEIDNFKPNERFISGKGLQVRWSHVKGVETFIRARINESMFFELHPTDGITQWTDSDTFWPEKETALFMLSEIEKIEALHSINVCAEEIEAVFNNQESVKDGSNLIDQEVEIEYNTSDNDIDSSDNELSTAFDPVPLSGIAKMFPLEKDEQQNLSKWKIYAAMASRNYLKNTRTLIGRGKAESKFDPLLVGEWLIERGLYARDKVGRKLASNLPPRNAHLKHLILP